MIALPDRIASLVHKLFDELPAKRKPAVRTNGLREWVPLSAIVAQDEHNELCCLSLATGMKCLPASRVADGSAQGDVLHDWHAEVLAIRAFNRLVLDECLRLARDPTYSSPWLRRRDDDETGAAPMAGASGAQHPSSTSQTLPVVSGDTEDADEGMGFEEGRGGEEDGAAPWLAQPFAWRDNIRLHMYCSEAPCGDASMELTMAAQEDAAPWAVPASSPGNPPPPAPASDGTTTPPPASTQPPPSAAAASPPELPGRAYFSLLGAVRRKPARADAPATLSKSCSDKLARRQCLSLLSGVASLLVARGPYLSTITLPAEQYSGAGCRRAFSAEGRMGGLLLGAGGEEGAAAAAAGHHRPQPHRTWGAGAYAFRPFAFRITRLEFAYSRRVLCPPIPPPPIPLPPPPDTILDPSRLPPPIPPPVPSNLATACVAPGDPARGRAETTVGGVLQGRRAGQRGAGSLASRRALWAVAAEAAAAAAAAAVAGGHDHDLDDHPDAPLLLLHRALCGDADTGSGSSPLTYAQVKVGPLLAARRRVKRDLEREALRGWVANAGDDGFRLLDAGGGGGGAAAR